MRGISVMMVESPVPGLLQFNMAPAGQVGGEERASIPVSDGIHTLQFFPLRANILPMTCRIEVEDGQPKPVPDEPRLTLRMWPGGIFEALLHPEVLEPAPPLPLSPISALRLPFTDQGRPLLAEWVSFGPWWLVIEQENGDPLMTEAVHEATGSGTLETAVINGVSCVVARAPAGPGAQWLGVAGCVNGQWTLLHTDVGQDVALENDALVVSQPMGETAGYTRHRRWRPGEGDQTEYARALTVQGRSPEQISRLFLEALLLGQTEDAAQLLTPALRHQLEDGQLSDYVGPIEDILPVRYGSADAPAWAVVRPAQDGLNAVAPLRFTMEDEFIDNIEEM